MRRRENIEKIIKKFDVTVNPERDQKIFNQLQKAQATSKQSISVFSVIDLWRIIMRNKLTKFAAAAAVIIIAVLIGINKFGGSIDGASVAFAEVLENISNVRSVVYKEISEVPKYTFQRVKMVNEEGVIRSELEHGTIIMIMDAVDSATLWLRPLEKKAERYGMPSTERKTKGFSCIGWVRKLHEGEAKFDGTEELDGHITNVYVWEVPFEKITVWVDPESNLPVKVEHKRFANTEKNIVMPKLTLSMGDFGGDENVGAGSGIGSARGSGLGISEDTTITMYDFQWDVELDESLFSLEPPEGYALEQIYPDDNPVDDNSLVHILGFWAEMRGGEFPDEQEINDPEAFKPLIIEKYNGNSDPNEEFNQARDEVNRVLGGIFIVQKKKVDGGWGYNGEGVVLGEAERIICWWFDEGTEGYKAIFGDLSIGDVTEDQLPIQP